MKATLLGYPAYGRSYANQEELQEAFLSGKDFSASLRGGPYFSVRDFTETSICKDFDRVTLIQVNPSRPSLGILCAVTILRSEMCGAKLLDELNRSTTDSPKVLSAEEGQLREVTRLGPSLPSVRQDASCVQERKQDE